MTTKMFDCSIIGWYISSANYSQGSKEWNEVWLYAYMRSLSTFSMKMFDDFIIGWCTFYYGIVLKYQKNEMRLGCVQIIYGYWGIMNKQ